MSLAFISHPDCLLHDMGLGHPEQAARIQAIEEKVMASEIRSNIKKHEAPLATREQLIKAHDAAYVDALFQQAPQSGMLIIDPDTSMNPHTLQAALRAAGAGILAVDLVMSAQAEQAFCNVRPPGHHAEHAQAMGFCFFNNVAVAVAYALEQYNLQRVAIIDFDVHHGNGTENIIKHDERVLLCSSFQHPFYPFSGAETISDHILNLPLPAGTSGRQWREAIETEWLQELENFKPQLLFFSAGFDGYINDELANFNLRPEDYAWLTRTIIDLTEGSAQRRVVSILEGGYDLKGLGDCALAHIEALL